MLSKLMRHPVDTSGLATTDLRVTSNALSCSGISLTDILRALRAPSLPEAAQSRRREVGRRSAFCSHGTDKIPEQTELLFRSELPVVRC